MSLVSRLLLLIALATTPVVATELYTQVELRQQRADAARADAARYARLVSSDAERVIEGVQGILIAVTELPFIRAPDLNLCASYFSRLAKRYPQLLNLTLIDHAGTPVCANTPIVPGASGADRFYFQEAMRTNGFVIGDYIVGRTVRGPQLPVALPFTDDAGERFVMAAGLNFDWLQEHFGSLTLPEGATLRIADRNGVILVAPDNGALIGQKLAPDWQAVRSPREGTFGRRDNDNSLHIVGFEPLNAAPVGLIIAVDLADRQISSAASASNSRDMLIVLLSALAAACVAWFGGRRFVNQPLMALTATAKAWTAGHIDARANLADRSSEIGLLGVAFDHMADVVQRNQQALRRMNDTLEQRVAERTAELSEANRQLETAMAEREKIEAALRQAQKMEAVGQLTGGIAHDFNNLLTVILGNLGLAAKRVGADEPVHRLIANAQVGGERAAQLTRHLLAFSRQQMLQPIAADPNQLILEMADFLHRTIGPSITIQTILAPAPWRISIDPGQLENALLNLCINARDAMPAGGILTIETANTELDSAYAATHPEVIPGDYVLIAVSDTGVGIPSEVAQRVFDPFFTTKPVGSGSGLGLSMVYGFVKQSSGHINVYSEVGRGTSFKVYLPRLLEPTVAAPAAQGAIASNNGGGERILLVDDDDQVRAYASLALAELGYQVTEAADATSAMAVLRSPAEIDLLFTDVGMPGQNGRMLADEARRIRPGLRVLFTTGYTRNAIVHHGVLDADVLVLLKPFTTAALASKLREALGDADQSAL